MPPAKQPLYVINPANLAPATLGAKGRSQLSNRRQTAAFTLVELLVAAGMIVLLATVLTPAMQPGVQTRAPASQCLNNHRQLMMAMMMYTADNHGYFPPNPDDGNLVAGHNWCPGWG